MTLPILATTALLVSCQPTAQTQAGENSVAPPTTEPVAQATVPVDEDSAARWITSQDGENRYLAFAVPESDDVRFTLSCGPGERFVRLWRETWDGDVPEFSLASGEVSAIYPGDVNPEGMAPQLDGVAPARAPIFEAFRSSGQLTLTVDGEARDLSAPVAALPEIDAFFAYCGPSGD